MKSDKLIITDSYIALFYTNSNKYLPMIGLIKFPIL